MRLSPVLIASVAVAVVGAAAIVGAWRHAGRRRRQAHRVEVIQEGLARARAKQASIDQAQDQAHGGGRAAPGFAMRARRPGRTD